jgi:hypothetical protein
LPIEPDSPVRSGFVHRQIMGRDQPHVGRNGGARFERHQIARHQMGAVHDLPLSVAHHPNPIRNQRVQRERAAFRLPLLDGADDGVDLKHGEDERRIGHLADAERDGGGGQQQINQRALKLPEIKPQPSDPARRRQAVRAERRETRGRLALR